MKFYNISCDGLEMVQVQIHRHMFGEAYDQYLINILKNLYGSLDSTFLESDKN